MTTFVKPLPRKLSICLKKRQISSDIDSIRDEISFKLRKSVEDDRIRIVLETLLKHSDYQDSAELLKVCHDLIMKEVYDRITKEVEAEAEYQREYGQVSVSEPKILDVDYDGKAYGVKYTYKDENDWKTKWKIFKPKYNWYDNEYIGEWEQSGVS